MDALQEFPAAFHDCFARSEPREGFVKLSRAILSSGKRVSSSAPPYPLDGPLRARHLGPTLASIPPLLTVCSCRPQMPPGSTVLGHGSSRRQKALGMAWGLQPLPATLSWARWPMRVLTPVVQVAALPLLDVRHPLALGGVALELIGTGACRSESTTPRRDAMYPRGGVGGDAADWHSPARPGDTIGGWLEVTSMLHSHRNSCTSR